MAKAWISVVDDPIQSNNQTNDGMQARIVTSYEVFKPRNAKYYTPEEVRKQWDRIKAVVSRFVGIYDNNFRTMTSGISMEDVKELSMRQFPEARKFGQFKYWYAYVELMLSPKFRSGMEAGWPKRMRLKISGDYSSSAGSHDVPTMPKRPLHQFPAAVARLGKKRQ